MDCAARRGAARSGGPGARMKERRGAGEAAANEEDSAGTHIREG